MQAVKCQANPYRGTLYLRLGTSCTRRLLGRDCLLAMPGPVSCLPSLIFKPPNWTPNLKRFILARPRGHARTCNQEADVTFRFANRLALLLICVTSVWAQDTAFVPGGATAWDPEWQQIAGPKCLEMRGAWEGGSSECSPDDHGNWLADLRHWRIERS